MTYRGAKKLHNGDEVIDKTTGESVKVLSIEEWPDVGHRGSSIVRIEGVGAKSGYRWWSHDEVR